MRSGDRMWRDHSEKIDVSYLSGALSTECDGSASEKGVVGVSVVTVDEPLQLT